MYIHTANASSEELRDARAAPKGRSMLTDNWILGPQSFTGSFIRQADTGPVRNLAQADRADSVMGTL